MPLTKENFKIFPEKTTLFLLALKPDGQVLDYNTMFKDLFTTSHSNCTLNIKQWLVAEEIPILEKLLLTLQRTQQSTAILLKLATIHTTVCDIKFDFSISDTIIYASGVAITSQNSEQKTLATVCELTKTGAWFYTPINNQLFWSEACYDIHELNKDHKICIATAIQYYEKEAQPKIKKYLENLITNGVSYDYIEKIITKKGARKYIRVIAKPVMHHKKVIQVNGTISDVTERQNYLKKLKKSKKTKRLALKGIQSGLFNHDIENAQIFYSKSFKKILGLPLTSEYVSEKEFLSKIHPDDIKEANERHLSNLKKIERHYYNFYRIQDSTGNYRHYEVYGYKKIDTKKRTKRVIGNLIDVQEKKEREQLISEQGGRLLAMINHGFTHAILLDTLGKIVMADKHTVEIIKKDFNIDPLVNSSLFQDVMPVNFKVTFAYEFNEALKGNVTKKQIERIADGGQTQWLQVSYIPICDENKVVYSVLLTFQNITDLKLAEYKIRKVYFKEQELSNLKSNLLSVFSHEIRTPLNGIMTISKLLLDEYNIQERNKLVEYLEESKDRLLDTLTNLSNFSKIGKIQSTLKLEPTDINFKVESCFKNLKHKAESKNLEYELHLSNNSPIAIIDKKVLSIAIYNILHNAIKYTEKGKIDVEIIDDLIKNQVHINIKDTGIGIEQKNLKKIFDPFIQESVGLSRKYEGTGIGLSLAKRFIEILNGSISVKSAINIGTSFQIVIPKHL